MLLTKVKYCENKDKSNYWNLSEVSLNNINLIVGINATGKTRLANVIANFAKILLKKRLSNGCFEYEFFDKEKNIRYEYCLEIKEGKILLEKIKAKEQILLERDKNKAEIFSFKENKLISISPPESELVLNVRRDLEEFPFFEDFINWAENLLSYTFSGIQSNSIDIPLKTTKAFKNLNSVAYLLEEINFDKNKEVILTDIINDISAIGYEIEKISIKEEINPQRVLLTLVKEKELNCSIDQTLMSNGMFRAISLVIILEYILHKKMNCSLVIDDLGEGLDCERSRNLTKLLINKIKDTNNQLIITSNDRFLINSVDIKYLNILERDKHEVISYNYENSKKHFEEFHLTGLNNFDFFIDQMYKEHPEENYG